MSEHENPIQALLKRSANRPKSSGAEPKEEQKPSADTASIEDQIPSVDTASIEELIQSSKATSKDEAVKSTDSLSELRVALTGSPDKEIQLKAFQTLKGNNRPEAKKIMAFALIIPEVQVKEEIFVFFNQIDRDEIYENLLDALNQGGETARMEVYRAFTQADLVQPYLEKIENIRHLRPKYSLLEKIIRFLGKLGVQEMMEPLGQLVFVDNEGIRLAVIDAFEFLDNRACLNYLLTAAKLFKGYVAERALNLINKFKDTNAILPLLYMLGEDKSQKGDLIFNILNGYDQDSLMKLVTTYLSQEDTALVDATLQYLKKTGNMDLTRAIREKYKENQTTKNVTGAFVSSLHDTLNFEIKNIGDLVLIGLKGILDVYTLPRLKRVMEAIITHGHTKVLFLCDQLDTLDRKAIAYLNKIDRNLKKMLGGIKYVKLDCLTIVEKKRLLPKADFFSSMPKAASSFSVMRRAKSILVDNVMVRDNAVIEVTFKAEGQEKTRTTSVLDADQFRVNLAWQIFDKSDIFERFINDRIKLTFVKDNDVLEAQSKVTEQVKAPVPCITIMRPRMACTVDRRKEIRVNCHFNVNFYHVSRGTEVAPAPLPGVCLNVNASGILYVSPLLLPEGSFGILQFPVEEIKVGKILGQIVRRNERVERSKMLYEYGINFAKILDYDRMTIKKFVFDKISKGE